MQSILQYLRRPIWGGDASGKFTDRTGSVPLFDILQGDCYGWEARSNAPEVNSSTGNNNNNHADQVEPDMWI